MPLYEYRCQQCGQTFEVIQKFSDAPLTTHVGCGGAVDKLLSSPAFQFKGSGWYITDYAKGGGSKGAAEGGTGDKNAPSAPASSESKTDSKPASTPSESK